MTSPTLNDWVWVEAMVVQSLVGAISTNVRQISLSYDTGVWRLCAVLDKPSAEDVETINATADDVSDLLVDIKDRLSENAYAEVKASVHVVGSEPLDARSMPENRILFRRKEP